MAPSRADLNSAAICKARHKSFSQRQTPMSRPGRIESDELGNLLLRAVLKRGGDHCSCISCYTCFSANGPITGMLQVWF